MAGPADSAEQKRQRNEDDGELPPRRDAGRNRGGWRIYGGTNGVKNLRGRRIRPVHNDNAVSAGSLHHMGEAA